MSNKKKGWYNFFKLSIFKCEFWPFLNPYMHKNWFWYLKISTTVPNTTPNIAYIFKIYWHFLHKKQMWDLCTKVGQWIWSLIFEFLDTDITVECVVLKYYTIHIKYCSRADLLMFFSQLFSDAKISIVWVYWILSIPLTKFELHIKPLKFRWKTIDAKSAFVVDGSRIIQGVS